MQNLKLLIGVVVGTLVLVFGVAILLSRQGGEEAPVAVNQEVAAGDARHVTVGLPQGGEESENTLGIESEEELATESAEPASVVRVVEFSDFQCPACGAAHPLVKQLLSLYGEKLEFGYRHFPLESIHRNARTAAVASEVAGEMGRFWEYHDLLFENQDEWAEEGKVEDKLVEYAVELGLSETEFRQGLERDDLNQLVSDDLSDGRAVGVSGTPTFFVDGERVNASTLAALVEDKVREL